MKLIRAMSAVLALLLLLPSLAGAAPNFPPLTGRVVDAAQLLSAEQKSQLEALSASVEQASSRQLVVATIPDLQGYDIADYGVQLGRAWGIGQKDANNGIILIVAPNDRKVRIEVGYGLEPIMTDALSGRIIRDEVLPRFRNKDIPGGIIAGANAIAQQMKLPLEAAEARARATAPPPRQKSGGGFPVGILFFLVILVFVIVPMIAHGARGRRYRGGGGNGVMPVVLWSIANEIGRQSRAGSSNWGGGGGSSWSGGGGSSWGGGGGGFSGGGGSFGGGGASGSW